VKAPCLGKKTKAHILTYLLKVNQQLKSYTALSC